MITLLNSHLHDGVIVLFVANLDIDRISQNFQLFFDGIVLELFVIELIYHVLCLFLFVSS